jgi:protein-disulfide isomerase
MVMNPRSVFATCLLATVACGAHSAQPAAPRAAALPSSSAAVGTVDPAASSNEDDAAVPISARNPSWGSRTALVTVVEFSDLQCPFCAKVAPTLAALRQAYGPEQLRIVWKNNPLPFHSSARSAAEAAMGVFELAGARAFWKFHDAAFEGQASLDQGSYDRWANDAGVGDAAAFRAGLASHRWAGAVDADLRDAKLLGVDGTPTFFINGVEVVGAESFDVFKQTIDGELVKAQAKVESGTPRIRAYAELTRDNRARAPKPSEDQDEGDDQDTRTVFKIPLGTSPVRGDATALVTIVEFSDFQCPFCDRVEPTLEAVRRKYGNEVRIVWKNEPLPFHANAEPAAQAALEVRAERGEAGFWAMHDKLFAAQSDLSMPVLARLAGEVGASPSRVRTAVSTHARAKEIAEDQDVAEDFQADGTPHFFIDGRRLVGAQPEEKFDAIIDEEIARAHGLLAKGIPLAGLYDELIRDGKTPAEPERKFLTPLPGGAPVRGNPAATVTVHEWADFQCPFCGRAEPAVAQAMKDYGTRIKLVWHDLPLAMHPDAPLAAQAAREAFRQKGSAGFWALHDRMFTDPQRLKRSDLDLDARSLGFDMRLWAASLDSGLHQHEIDAEKKAADDMGINGTPAFVVVSGNGTSGYFISGAQPYSTFRKVIERALAEAK